MLDLIRANAQSWGVKIAFGIIILVFVFWGVGGLTGGPSTVILTVNGEPITIQEFQRKYEQLEQQVRAQYPDLDAAGLKAMQLKQQLIQNLIVLHFLLILQKSLLISLIQHIHTGIFQVIISTEHIFTSCYFFNRGHL